MRFNLFSLIGVMAMVVGTSPYALDSVPTVGREIDALLHTLGRSNCQFSRNGQWYSSDEASLHLKSKLQYLSATGSLNTTEQFIDLAASTSSVSGVPYQVKCVDAGVVESHRWLTEQLHLLRKNIRK